MKRKKPSFHWRKTKKGRVKINPHIKKKKVKKRSGIETDVRAIAKVIRREGGQDYLARDLYTNRGVLYGRAGTPIGESRAHEVSRGYKTKKLFDYGGA